MSTLLLSLLRSGSLPEGDAELLARIRRTPPLPYPGIDPSAAHEDEVPAHLRGRWIRDEREESERIAMRFAREHWSAVRLAQLVISYALMVICLLLLLVLVVPLAVVHDAFAGALLVLVIAGGVGAMSAVAWVRLVRIGSAYRAGAVAWAAHAADVQGAADLSGGWRRGIRIVVGVLGMAASVGAVVAVASALQAVPPALPVGIGVGVLLLAALTTLVVASLLRGIPRR